MQFEISFSLITLNGTKIKKNSQMANWALVFIIVKNNFGFEKCLDKIKNFEQRRTSTRFRISAHKLTIETWQIQGNSPTRQNLHTMHG